MPYLRLSDASIRYTVTGSDGPPIIVCHGLTSDGYEGQRFVEGLSGYKVVTWDCRAHGDTHPLDGGAKLDFTTFVGDLRQLVDHLSLPRVILFGYSMGAGIAASFASRWPARVSALILTSPAWLTRRNPPNLDALQEIGNNLNRFSPVICRRLLRRTPRYRELCSSLPLAADALDRQFRKPRFHLRRVRLVQVPKSAPISRWKEVAAIACPVLVVGSRQDPFHPFEYAKRWAEKLRSSIFVEIHSRYKDRSKSERELLLCLRTFLDTVRV